jgi:hypothetical protein
MDGREENQMQSWGRLAWQADEDERDLFLLSLSLSLSQTLPPFRFPLVEKRRGEKNELLEEQEKFVNFWSSYSLPAPCIVLPKYQGLVVDRRRH